MRCELLSESGMRLTFRGPVEARARDCRKVADDVAKVGGNRAQGSRQRLRAWAKKKGDSVQVRQLNCLCSGR
jgi:hypothetical protein